MKGRFTSLPRSRARRISVAIVPAHPGLVKYGVRGLWPGHLTRRFCHCQFGQQRALRSHPFDTTPRIYSGQAVDFEEATSVWHPRCRIFSGDQTVASASMVVGHRQRFEVMLWVT